jgi:methionine biosynthesis protein MetW
MRTDLDIVAAMIPIGSRVLDLGCGDGSLLQHLIRARGCEGQGVEISRAGFEACVDRGVPVVELDIDQGLADFQDQSFDVVVLSQTLQATRLPAYVLREVMRVGHFGIVSFPNFGHWRVRTALTLRGRMPSSPALPYSWHETPNIHLCTIRDFEALIRAEGIGATQRILLSSSGGVARAHVARRPNALAAGAVYGLVG